MKEHARRWYQRLLKCAKSEGIPAEQLYDRLGPPPPGLWYVLNYLAARADYELTEVSPPGSESEKRSYAVEFYYSEDAEFATEGGASAALLDFIAECISRCTTYGGAAGDRGVVEYRCMHGMSWALAHSEIYRDDCKVSLIFRDIIPRDD